MRALCLRRPEEGLGSPGTEITDGWVLGVELSSLEEESVLLTAKPSPPGLKTDLIVANNFEDSFHDILLPSPDLHFDLLYSPHKCFRRLEDKGREIAIIL